MTKKPPHLVMAKQPTIISKDPFQTAKEEEACKKAFRKVLTAWFNQVKADLKPYFDQREMEATSLPRGVSFPSLDTDSLIVIAEEYVPKGYLKGIKYTGKQLAPLNIGIEVNIGDPIHHDALDNLRKRAEETVNKYSSDLEKRLRDLVIDNLEGDLTYADLVDLLQDEFGLSLKEADRIATDEIINAAREAEKKTLQDAGVTIYQWVTVVDVGTCWTCLALNGKIFTDDPMDRGLVDFDSGEFLEDILADLTPHEGFINPAEGKYGPALHTKCRCHLSPVITQEQYSGSVNKIVSEV